MRNHFSFKKNNCKPCTTILEMSEHFGISVNSMRNRVSRNSDRPHPIDGIANGNTSARYYNKKEFIDWYKRNYLNDEIEKIL